MDWQHVTVEELLSALREEDWSQRPRTLLDFVGQFSTPRNQRKWESRLKCNAYYYHTNYALVALAWLLLPQYNRPLALLGAMLLFASVLLLNNTFASSTEPPGRDGRTKVTILGMPRGLAVLISTILALVMVQRGRGILRGLLGLVVGLGLIVGHASLRNPNLKARLSNARDEFRAVWRNAQFHDYTL